MLSKFGVHLRHHVVAYLALFVALGGTAVAARPLLTGADIQDGSLTDADVATTNKDGTADTLSLRTLGKGAQQAVAGNDARLSDARPPTGTAGGDLTGSYPHPTIGAGAIGTSQVSSSIPVVRAQGAVGPRNDALFQTVPSTPPSFGAFLDAPVEQYDSADMHSATTDPSRLTAPVAGVYRISAEVLWDGSPNGERLLVLRATRPNVSDTVIAGTGDPAAEVTRSGQAITAEYKLAAGDFVRMFVQQDSGVDASAWPRGLTMSWVAPG